MGVRFLKKLFNSSLRPNLASDVCRHLILAETDVLLDLFELEESYQVKKDGELKEKCVFKVNHQQVIFYRSPFTISGFQFSNEDITLDTYEFLDHLFSMLPSETQLELMEIYYDPTKHSALLDHHFNTSISGKVFQTMDAAILKHMNFESLKLVQQDDDCLTFLSACPDLGNLNARIQRKCDWICYFDSRAPRLPLDRFVINKIGKLAQKDLPNISFDQFHHFHQIFASTLVENYVNSREYQVKSKFNMETKIDEDFLSTLKNTRYIDTL